MGLKVKTDLGLNVASITYIVPLSKPELQSFFGFAFVSFLDF